MSRSPHTATAIGVGLVVAGFVMVMLGWKGGAATLFVPSQVAFAVSGGMIGLGLIGMGLAVLAVQATRLSTARRSQDLQRLVADTVDLFSAVRARPADGTRRRQVPIPPRPIAPDTADAAELVSSNGQGPPVADAAFRPHVLLLPGTKTYHWSGCRIVPAAASPLHLTVEEADAVGLRPCRICAPVAEEPDVRT